MFSCLECGRKFKTAAAAERAADRGCPKCGGVDIDCEPMFTFVRANPDNVKRDNEPSPGFNATQACAASGC